MAINLFYILLTSLLASLVLTPSMGKLAARFGGMDLVDSRKIHSRSVPRLGGVAIAFAVVLALVLFVNIDQKVIGFLSGAALVFLTGIADDLFELSPGNKFLGQFAAVLTGIFIGGIQVGSLGNLFGTGNIDLGPLSIPFTIFAMVGVINAINFIDGLDGLAGGIAVIAASAMAVLAISTDNTSLLAMSIAVVGAVLGFLRYNTFPASIFMGDCGSLFLGYSLAYFSVMVVSDGGGRVSQAAPLAILAIPVFDALLVIVKRLLKGRKIFAPDNSHIHHRLLDIGISHKHAVIVVHAFAYVLAVLAVTVHKLDAYAAVLGIFLVFGIFIVANSFFSGKWQRSSMSQTPLTIQAVSWFEKIYFPLRVPFIFLLISVPILNSHFISGNPLLAGKLVVLFAAYNIIFFYSRSSKVKIITRATIVALVTFSIESLLV